MSFALRCKKFDELESEARSGTLTIGKLFGSPASCTVLGQQHKHIEAFVYENMSEIIAIAVGGLPCPNQAVVKGTYEFMSELPLSFKMRVGPKAHKVLEYLMKLVIEERPYIPKHVLGLFKELYLKTLEYYWWLPHIPAAMRDKVVPSNFGDKFLNMLGRNPHSCLANACQSFCQVMF